MNNFKWYMISTVRGKEEQVIEALNNRIIAENVAESFNQYATQDGAFKIFKKPILTAKELEKRRLGQEYKVKYTNLYPGYIFANMDMTDEAWYVVRNTQNVTGIIGSSGKGAKPTPVSSREIRKMEKAAEDSTHLFNLGKNLQGLKINDLVVVLDGPFKGEIGPIKSLNLDSNIATIQIESFGKRTSVELSIDSLEHSTEY